MVVRSLFLSDLLKRPLVYIPCLTNFVFAFVSAAWVPVRPVCECTVQLLGGAHTSPRLLLQSSSQGTLLRSAYGTNSFTLTLIQEHPIVIKDDFLLVFAFARRLSAETCFSDVNEAMLEIRMPNEASFGTRLPGCRCVHRDSFHSLHWLACIFHLSVQASCLIRATIARDSSRNAKS